MPQINVLAQRPTKVFSEILVAGFFEDDRPLTGLAAELDWIQNGLISRLILRGKIRGGWQESTLLAAQHKLRADKILLMGLGPRSGWTEKSLDGIYFHIDRILSKLQVKDCAVEVFGPSRAVPEDSAALKVIQSRLGTGTGRDLEITLLVPDEERAQRIRQKIRTTVGNA